MAAPGDHPRRADPSGGHGLVPVSVGGGGVLAAFDDQVVGGRGVTVDGGEGLLVVLVEEVLLAKLDELVVQPVQQRGVALLDGGRDVAGVTQALDADAEAGVQRRNRDALLHRAAELALMNWL